MKRGELQAIRRASPYREQLALMGKILKRASHRLPGKKPRPKLSVWLVCWNSWDYDHHEDPREAWGTEAEAVAAAKSKPEGLYDDKNNREGWSVMEVEWGRLAK